MDNQQAQNFGFNINTEGPMPPGAQAPHDQAQGKKGTPGPMGPSSTELLDRINSLSRRLRMIEERYTNLMNKNQLSDQNMLSHNKKLNTEIKTINLEISEFRSDFSKLKETIALIIQDLRECARKEDVEVLEKYLKLWEPVRFVTQNQVENIVRETIENMGIRRAEEEPPKKDQRQYSPGV